MSLLYIYNENSGILSYRKRSEKDKDKLMYWSKSNCWHLAAGKVAQRFFLKLFQFNKLIQPGAKLVFIASDSFWMLFLLQQEEHYQKCHQSRCENWLKLLWKRKITNGVTTLYWFVLSCVRAEQSTEAKARSILKEESKIEFLSTGRITRSTQG